MILRSEYLWIYFKIPFANLYLGQNKVDGEWTKPTWWILTEQYLWTKRV